MRTLGGAFGQLFNTRRQVSELARGHHLRHQRRHETPDSGHRCCCARSPRRPGLASMAWRHRAAHTSPLIGTSSNRDGSRPGGIDGHTYAPRHRCGAHPDSLRQPAHGGGPRLCTSLRRFGESPLARPRRATRRCIRPRIPSPDRPPPTRDRRDSVAQGRAPGFWPGSRHLREGRLRGERWRCQWRCDAYR